MPEITVKRNPKKYNEFTLKGKFTAGQIESIIAGLAIWSGNATLAPGVKSPVAEDVWFALRQATLDGNGNSILTV